MKYSLNNFLFVILTFILIILPFTSAPWTNNDPPNTPEPGRVMYCFEWLMYNKFDFIDVNLNVFKATNRSVRLDGLAYLWSAAYAYVLTGVSLEQPKPIEFCMNRKVLTGQSFVALKNAKRTCIDWIFLYGYEIDFPDEYNIRYNIVTNDLSDSMSFALDQYRKNKYKAYNRDILVDNDIPHWVASYGELINTFDENVIITPAAFCAGLGLITNVSLPYMIRRVPKLTCAKWILMHGFTINIEVNVIIANLGYDPLYLSKIHFLAKQYADHILDASEPTKLEPVSYCQSKYNMDNETRIPFYQ